MQNFEANANVPSSSNPAEEPKTVNVTDLAALDAAFENAHRHLAHGALANYRVGFWLNRAKEIAPHGYFFPILEKFAEKCGVSVETLRRRMCYYREIKSGLAKLPFGLAIPADEIDSVISDEKAAADKVAQVKSAIKAAAAIRERDVNAPKNLAANLRLEGFDEDRHEAITKTISHIKRSVGPVVFAQRLALYLEAWEKELPVEEPKKPKAAKKTKVPETTPAAPDATSTPTEQTTAASPVPEHSEPTTTADQNTGQAFTTEIDPVLNA